MYIGSTTKIPVESKNNRSRIHVVLKCDVCNNEFERWQNAKTVAARLRHYCSPKCFQAAMKSGGIADTSRKVVCMERYGSPYFITRHDIASASGKAAHTPEIETKRWTKIKKSWSITAVHLRRGLTLTRSRAEIDFFQRLSETLKTPIECPKYINHWWIDGYITALDVYVQFDGAYWHSSPSAQERDKKQDAWFPAQNKVLIRITYADWCRDPCAVLSLFTQFQMES